MSAVFLILAVSNEPQVNESFLIQQFFKNAGEVWARCGRVAHICGANSILQSVFPAAIACFKIFKFRQSCIMSVKVASSDKATGQLQHAGRQKQGWNPLLPDAEDRFP